MDEIRLLEAARATWRRTQPSDRDLQRAVTRVTLAMRAGRARSPRAAPALATAIALIATLAYAGASRWLTRHAPPPLRAVPAISPSPPTPTPTPTSTPTPTPTSTPTPTAHPTWADVSRALASNDTRAAERALRDLATRGDPSTRAKARLGLAQLALARGDKAHSAALARQVLAMRGIEPPLTARAREIALSSSEP